MDGDYTSPPCSPSAASVSSSIQATEFLKARQVMTELDQKKRLLDSLMNSKEQMRKHFQDKHMELQIIQEIRRPLEVALVDIDVLHQKLERRESMIRLLRHQLLSLPPSDINAAEELRKRGSDTARDDHWRLLVIMDEKAELLKEIEHLSKKK
jgi:hypothetical protein